MSVEGATKTFPAEAGISRYGKPEKIADLMAFLVSASGKVVDRHFRPHGRRRSQRYLNQAVVTCMTIMEAAVAEHAQVSAIKVDL